MNVEVVKREGRVFDLADGFVVEVEDTNLYRLSQQGWVISPVDDIAKLCEFIHRNT
jgi:hypothetical protein